MPPGLLIADEPTTALDVTIQAQSLELIRGLQKPQHGRLFITHNLGVIARSQISRSDVPGSRGGVWDR